MEESLKNGQLIHRLIVFSSFVAFFFGLAIPSRHSLDKAIQELELISALDLESQAEQEFNKNLSVKKYREKIKDILAKAEIRTIDENVVTSFPIEHTALSPPSAATLEQLSSFIHTHHKPRYYVVAPNDADSESIRKTFLKWPFYEAETVEIVFADEKSGLNYVNVLINGRKINDKEFLVTSTKITIDMFPLSWIRADPDTLSLLQDDDGQQILFPNLRHYWWRVKSLTPGAAMDLLESERSQYQDHISLLGVSVPGDLVVIAVPSVVLILMTGLLLNLRHVVALSGKAIDCHKLLTFPWIVLFPGMLSKIAVVISICLVPLLAIFTVFVQAWNVASILSLGVGIVILGCTVVATIATCQLALNLNLPDEGPSPDASNE